ncbi:MAG: low molecular weight phosphotyrosine protein phosphatase [Anaerolineae bacterium]|nr:low molecular weight phosphotyrosine protein phosphatase [Anaerolineae bacterium]
MQQNDRVRVLFVCLGNICRSPMAEGVFSHLVKEAGLGDRIVVDSAGTGDWHIGERAHPGTRDILKQHDIDYDGRARQLTDADLGAFDYILAMDRNNLADLRARANGATPAEIRLFLDYAEGVNEREVPDPYYSGRFEEVYRLVRAAAEGLLDHIRARHGL